jgi:serine/threonine protein kinase
VCDFGISAIVGQQDGTALRGTPRFMAPEVARQLTISNFPATDAYGLGMILHDLAHVGTDAAAPARLLKAGRDPATALSESASAVTAASWAANRILFEREFAGFAATVAPSVPQPLAELIRQCLEVVPEQRPTVERLRLSLAQLVDGASSW